MRRTLLMFALSGAAVACRTAGVADKADTRVVLCTTCTAISELSHQRTILVRYRSGETAENVLRDITRQRDHLYVVVADAPASTHRLSTDIVGRIPMSRVVRAFVQSARVKAAHYPQEPNSPRGTLKISGGVADARAVHAIITRDIIHTSK